MKPRDFRGMGRDENKANEIAISMEKQMQRFSLPERYILIQLLILF